MKKILLFLCVIATYTTSIAQENYTINGENLQLKIEVDGKLDLLWNIIDNQYRYFLRTSDDTITELVNTKDANGDYREEYKQVLTEAASGSNLSTKKVNLTLQGLRDYLDAYNKKTDTAYASKNIKGRAQIRLGIFGGITNSPLVENPDNVSAPLAGVEFEVSEGKEIPRHSGFLRLRHVFEKDDFKYTATQLSLGYRFRFIKSSPFNLFADVEYASLSFSKTTFINLDGVLITEDMTQTAFDVPFIFGIGADFQFAKGHFLTFGYNQIFAVFLDNQGNTSKDFTFGYKIKL